MQDFGSGLSDLASGARGTAVLLEEGAPAGMDILRQLGQLFGEWAGNLFGQISLIEHSSEGTVELGVKESIWGFVTLP